MRISGCKLVDEKIEMYIQDMKLREWKQRIHESCGYIVSAGDSCYFGIAHCGKLINYDWYVEELPAYCHIPGTRRFEYYWKLFVNKLIRGTAERAEKNFLKDYTPLINGLVVATYNSDPDGTYNKEFAEELIDTLHPHLKDIVVNITKCGYSGRNGLTELIVETTPQYLASLKNIAPSYKQNNASSNSVR